MRVHSAKLWFPAFAVVFAACQDTATAPRRGADNDPRPAFNATSATTQYHFVANGVFGYASWYQSDGQQFSYGYLSVGRGGTTTNPQTWLSYYSIQCDWYYTCSSIQAGYGLIPNSDLAGGGSRLSLNTNTSGNPDFFVWAGSPGQVSVDFRADGRYSSSSSGTSEYSYASSCDAQVCYPSFRNRFQGRSTYASASATGSVVGVPIPPAWASIGVNHQVSISIYR